MSPLEGEIRDTLRSEAARLSEVRPLRLPPAPAHDELRPALRFPRARRLRTWLGPAVAVAMVLAIAATLVTLKSLRSNTVPAAKPSSIAGPPLPAGATPRYYVSLGLVQGKRGWNIIAGDGQTGKQIASYALPQGDVLSGAAVSGAADDRTFVVTGAIGQTPTVREGNKTVAQAGKTVFGPVMWFLVRINPGSADPLLVTRLAIQAPGVGRGSIALSGDGTELAVMSPSGTSSFALLTYSVATGRLQHSWSATITAPAHGPSPVTDLSWVGDSTVGFAVVYNPKVREEVRTLDISAAGTDTDLLADSRLVWSQYVPAPPGGTYQEATPQACETPFLSGDGQAVVCATSTYSAAAKRLSATWLAFPLATPTRARVLGSVPQPANVSTLDPLTVGWTNPSGTEVIGRWNPTVVTFPGTSHSVWSTTNYNGVIGNGTVRKFPMIFDPDVAW